MAFYDRFEALCHAKGITPTGAARENGISQSVVGMWKKRGSMPKWETIEKLAIYFDVSVDYLIGFNPLPETWKGSPYEASDLSYTLKYLYFLGYILMGESKNSDTPVVSVLDRRADKWYVIPVSDLFEIEQRILTFSKSQINEVLSKYIPITDISIGELSSIMKAPQQPTAPSEGKTEKPPEGPQEGAGTD